MRLIKRIFIYLLLLVLAIVFLIPIYGLFMNSFKSLKELSTNQWGLPSEFKFDNYKNVWTGGGDPNDRVQIVGMQQYLFNSFKITIPTIIIQIFLSFLLGFSLSRFKFRYTNILLVIIVFGLAVPYQIMLIPIFKMVNALRIYDTIFSLIFVYVGFGIPFVTFFIRNYMVQIPLEIQEAALVDGANFWTILFKIMLPICKPAIGVMFIIQFNSTFNEFLYAFILTSSQTSSPMPVAVAKLSQSLFATQWHYQATASIMMSIPSIMIFILFQRFFIKGLVAGSVKG